jgi:hypothetical protein
MAQTASNNFACSMERRNCIPRSLASNEEHNAPKFSYIASSVCGHVSLALLGFIFNYNSKVCGLHVLVKIDKKRNY